MTDLILHNGNIHTLDDTRPHATAIAIHGERIAQVGDDDAVLATRAESTKIVDLKGMAVLPGLIDAHGHVRNFGRLQEMVQLYNVRSLEEVVELVREHARDVPKGEWIVGRGWNQELWPDKSMPSHDLLSEAVPDHPVWLVRVDAHAGVANAAAMRVAGVDSSARSPNGGIVVKEGGRLTGLFVDDAMQLIEPHIPGPDLDKVMEWYLKAQKICLSMGLTEVHEAGLSQRQFDALVSLSQSGKLKMRVYGMLHQSVFDNGEFAPVYEDRFTCQSIKIVADGALGSRGAAMFDPYSDSPNEKGFMRITREGLLASTTKAFGSGFQVNTHAIGDLANREALDVIATALKANPVSDHRSRIEHAQIVALDDIPRFADLGVIASIQPTHCTSDMNMAEARLGSERVKGAYAWRKFIDSGVRIASGSDFPVESPNPLWGLYAAVTRQDHSGQPNGGWYPEERMTMNEALRSFTIDAAYAAFEENDKGTISTDKWADLTIVNSDIANLPPADLLSAIVMATIVGGEVVYSNSPMLQAVQA